MTLDRMVKNNQRFEFRDVLSIESMIPKDELRASQITCSQLPAEAKIQHRYHLHSILVHRGTLDFGHYYAFIRPHLDNRWFEFNDSKVQEVTKNYAMRQGFGG